MPRFFVDSIEESSIEISGGDARHIALSLRMKQGDGLVLCDGNGGEAVCKIASLCPESVILDVEERRKSLAEPKTRVTLYQAIPKSDKLEYIVQKAVELGAYRIVPVLTSRCISRPDEKSAVKKLKVKQKLMQIQNRLILRKLQKAKLQKEKHLQLMVNKKFSKALI